MQQDEIYDANEVHPLGVPEEVVVPPDQFFISKNNNKTPEETYDILVKELQNVKSPLLVSGSMLIDQLRFVDGTISGHIAKTGTEDGFTPNEIWIDLSGHDIRTLKSDELVQVNEQQDYCMPVYQFQCRWCGNSHTYSDVKEARRHGWQRVVDPLNSDWWFCPNEDCREMADQYIDLFDRLEDE